MKPRLLILLLLCALLLAACYRQTEEPFQQADSAVVVAVLTPTSIQDVVEADGETVAGEADAAAETRQYVTPETVPGQVAQPTIELPTQVVIAVTSSSLTLTPFVRPTETVAVVVELDPTHACVYTVQPGDNLFRLSLSWNTTVQEIMDASQIDSDALSIGQLLLRPGCDYSLATDIPTEAPAPVAVDTEAPPEPDTETAEETAVEASEAGTESTTEAAPVTETATATDIVDTPTPGPRIHVVSAGETIESISLNYRVDVNELIALNSLANPNQLSVGQELLLPE